MMSIRSFSCDQEFCRFDVLGSVVRKLSKLAMYRNRLASSSQWLSPVVQKVRSFCELATASLFVGYIAMGLKVSPSLRC